MNAQGVPFEFRDSCVADLMVLNRCRLDNYGAPWACGHERHHYEQCQATEWRRRVALKQAETEAAAEDG